MRIGQNPAKAGIKAREFSRLGVGIISFIPNQVGYFAESLKILKLEIASLHKNTSEKFDLYLFDNGSCPEVQQELILLNQKGFIDFLVLSNHNLGKFGAMNWLMASMENEWIMYVDSDFFFRKDWLEESYRLAKAFPSAGMITAQPNFFDQLEGKGIAIKSIDSNDVQIFSQTLPEQTIDEYCRGIGVSDETRKGLLKTPSLILDEREHKTQAVYGACTAQFLGKKETFRQIFPLPHDFIIAREEDNELCRRIDSNGWLEISTLQPLVVHMGNHINPEIIKEAEVDGIELDFVESNQEISSHKKNMAWKLIYKLNQNSFFRKVFKRLYINLFELYSLEKK